jgi:hypothetical protein
MIIQVRGTSGSGKTTIVRNIMELFPPENKKPVMRTGRKQPIAYRFRHPVPEHKELAVIGHYETKCGGCDTISTPGQSYPIIFELIRRNAEEGRNVLFEGLLISGDLKWSSQLKDLDFRIIELTTSLDECLESINTRRKARLEGSGKEFTPVDPNNTSSKHALIQRCNEKLNREHGIVIEKLSREDAFNRIKELLNV